MLRQTAEMLRPVKGRRKAILYVGEGIDYELGDRTIELMQDVNTFLATVSRANVVMYTLDPTGMHAPQLALDVNPHADGGGGDFGRALDDAGARAYGTLRAWAGESGGVAVVNTNNLAGGLAAIVEHSSRYYVLGYESPVDSDGRFHRIQVRAAAPGLTVQSRRGYVAAARPAITAKGAGATAATPPGGAGAALDEALASPVAATGVRLRVFAAPFKGSGPKHDVLVGLHVDGRDLGLTASDAPSSASALIEIVVLDEAGRVAASTRNSIDVTVPVSSLRMLQARGLRYLDRVGLAPGKYKVRAGAAVGGDRLGTVDTPLVVPDYTAPGIALSGVLVSTNHPAPGHSTGSYYAEWLPGPATAQRRFRREDEINVFAELYGRGQPTPLTLVRRVLNEQGAVEIEDEEAVDGGVAGGAVPLRARIPLDPLGPGRYRLRLEVREAGATASVAAREVIFTVANDEGEPQ